MAPRLVYALFCCAALGAQAPQIPEDAWKAGATVPLGAVAVVAGLPVSLDLFVDEMAARHVRADSGVGRDTLASIVDEVLLTNEASRRHLTISDADVDCTVTQYDCQLKQAKTSLDAELKKKGISTELFRQKTRLQLMLQRLTREDQHIGKNDPVTNEQQKVWLKNKRDASQIELDRTKLKHGECAVVDGTPVSDVTFVRALLASAERKDVRRIADFTLQFVFAMHLIEQAGLELTDADIDQEFQDRKRLFESNPEYRGIAYEAIVKERTGLDPAALKQSRAFRVNAAVSKLGRKLFSPTDVKGYYEMNLGSFGPWYTVRHLLIRGTDRTQRDISGKLIQPLDQARRQIDGIRADLAKGKTFEDLARMYSEHMPSKIRSGLLDAFTPKNAPTAFPELGEAVTKLEIMKVSEPILTSAGYHLVRVERMDPPKPLDQVEPDIRQLLANRYFSDAIDKAPRGYDIRLD